MNQISILFFLILSLSGIDFLLKHRIHQKQGIISLLEQKCQREEQNKQKILKLRQFSHKNPKAFRFFQKIKFNISPVVLDENIQSLKKKLKINFITRVMD